MIALHDLTIVEAADFIRRRELSPVALTRACLERIDEVEGRLNAFITILRDEAFQAAQEAEQEIEAGSYRGPLHGIPIGVKDLYDTAGILTTAGSKIFAGRVPAADAAAVERLKAAGAVIVGKLNMHEFANGVTNSSSYYGPTRNPWDTSRISGGSSGGSGAAVAAGECLAALGTDTGGSIRIPASLCGIVGLKPTYGLVSRRGVVPLAWSLDHCGPMTRTALDVALMLNVLAGRDADDPTSAEVQSVDYAEGIEVGIRGLRIGLPRRYFYEEVEPEVLGAVEGAVQELSRLGASVQDVEIPSVDYIAATFGAIIASEYTNYHLALLRRYAADYQPDVRRRFETGLLYAPYYIQAQRVRTVLLEEMKRTLETVDILAVPTTPVTATELDDGLETAPSTRLLNKLTRPFNVTGLPAISIPCGFTEQGLPVGLQIVGRPFEERTVLRAAYAYEQRSEWCKRRPPL